MNVLDVDLDNIRSSEEEDDLPSGNDEAVVVTEVSGGTSGHNTTIAPSGERDKAKPQQTVAPAKEAESGSSTKQAKQEAKVPAKA